MRCEHYACRCARAAALADQAERTGDVRLLAQALAVHNQTVECRLSAKEIEELAALWAEYQRRLALSELIRGADICDDAMRESHSRDM